MRGLQFYVYHLQTLLSLLLTYEISYVIVDIVTSNCAIAWSCCLVPGLIDGLGEMWNKYKHIYSC